MESDHQVNNDNLLMREVGKWGWVLVLSFVLVLPFKHLYELPFLLMAVMGLVLLVMRPRAVVAMPAIKPILVMGACFWLPMVASLPDAINFPRAAETTLTYLRFPLAGIFVVFALQGEDGRRRLLTFLALALSFSATCVVLQAMQGHMLNLPDGLINALHVFSSQRAVGHVLAVLSPIYFYWIWRQGLQRPWIWPVSLIYVMAIFFSNARVAWIMLAVSILFLAVQLIWVERVRWRWKPVVALALLGALAVGTALQQPVLQARLKQTAGLFSGNYDQTNVATSARLPIWKVSMKVIRDHWINGIGPRGFRYIYPQYAEKGDPFVGENQNLGANHPHQMLLEIATETGVIGVIGYLTALIYWLRMGWTVVREKQGQVLPMLVAVLIAIMPINAHMAFYASFWSCVTWWLILLALAFWQWERIGSRQ